ncbi:PRC-barrel domain-containing protein [Acuticoccus mangrovi]|uniref:PRC-barrel domain-containing protein n=1 Tax=Acuticoccus mangrovi TaxID=2796142 RepID=A0A934ITB3_9HYPH|nr:PRC-barrel domain-containing protein [Acuticoccus mangrovi]MBJ3777294.1 PRC-barrel domain-containing protein [Acuticoccus mangrovi]
MSNKSNIWLATVSSLVLLASPVLADDANVTIVKPDGPAEQAGEAVDNAAAATADTVSDAADATADATGDAVQATEHAAKNAADAAENAADHAEVAAENAATNAEKAMDSAATSTTASMESADEAEIAEGTPVEGQIFEQSPDTFLASTLLDTVVMNASDEKIGDINDMVITADGQVSGVVIGVGGFLGIGEKDVAIELSRLDISEDEDGDLVFMLDATEEELKAAPEFMTQEDVAANDAATAPAAPVSN